MLRVANRLNVPVVDGRRRSRSLFLTSLKYESHAKKNVRNVRFHCHLLNEREPTIVPAGPEYKWCFYEVSRMSTNLLRKPWVSRRAGRENEKGLGKA
jgi:hypothetical protein